MVSLNRIPLSGCDPWFYDDITGTIHNKNNTFFSICAVRQSDGERIIAEQPMIDQPEIGFLGIIVCRINDTWHYLMQAKIEPGNVNVVQLSPTLQATRSNFTGAHGGKLPDYLEHFMHMTPEHIIVDQIQSEQSSRFLKKRNRNVILKSDEQLPEIPSHRWMTLSQIKSMMKINNLVNMDTRTVLSCFPYALMDEGDFAPFKDRSYFYRSAWQIDRETIVQIYNSMNNYKMFHGDRLKRIPLRKLSRWEISDDGISSDRASFSVIYCDISIEGREVTHWKQPLIAAAGKALFGLFCCDEDGVLKFLVRIRPEIGSFDSAEIGPSVQLEAHSSASDAVEKLFMRKLSGGGADVLTDVILSEEGGRFYQEENRNAIIHIERGELPELPPDYIWSDYGTLNMLTQVNNCLNIQLRNLISLLEI